MKNVLKRSLLCLLPLAFHSCFLIKLPIDVTSSPVKDTVNVYHIIVSRNAKKTADTATLNSFKRESDKAYSWITKEARRHSRDLHFRSTWLTNKDTALNSTFVYKFHSNDIKVLMRKGLVRVENKEKKTKKDRYKIINWQRAMFDSVARQVADTSLARQVFRNDSCSENQLIVVHLLKPKKSKVLGFYGSGKAFIGNNKSETIAHESLHYLGAPDLYVHKFWFGKRRRLAVKGFRQEIMNGAIARNYDCNTYYLSDFTAYTMGWTTRIDKEGKPLLKENLMARFVLFVWLLF